MPACACTTRRRHGPPLLLRFRVGIGSGPALVGNIGAPQMRNYTAIGDTTNTPRLHGIAEPGQAVIAETTRHHLGADAATHPRGPVRVSGRREPVMCFTLIALTTAKNIGRLQGMTDGHD